MSGPPPVAIGGVGGSGTRLVSELVRRLGVHPGTDLNDASDTLWFTLLFKRADAPGCSEPEMDALTDIFLAGLMQGAPLDAAARSLVRSLASHDRPKHPAAWLQERAESLIEAARRPAHGLRWGWKEPNTHMVIERLWKRLPHLRYIHMVRNGLQMATSSNQNQLQLWGPRVLGGNLPATPRHSLAYWCKVHQRMQALLARNPHRMLWVDFDRLCRAPESEAPRIARFLDIPPDAVLRSMPEIRPPAPRPQRLEDFEPAHVDYVASLGYAIAAAA